MRHQLVPTRDKLVGLPDELTEWIRTVVEGRPRHEQDDAKRDLAAWINLNISTRRKTKYQAMCMDLLVQALEEKEQGIGK